jgi:serine/threonine-protein kinase
MSPEQAQGLPVDHRTDIWSQGVILYEMLTGKKPFKGEFDQAIMYNIVNSEPEPISDYIAEIPNELENLIEKALEKNTEDRIQKIEEIGDVLKSVKAIITSGIIKVKSVEKMPRDSIVVLPFSNISADTENEYFCDGLSEELINALSQIKDLRVIGRTSAFAFKGKAKDLTEIAKTLKVKKILDGSVRKAGNRLRISAEFINVKDGYQIWSEKFDRESGDIFAIQDDIAATIVKILKIRLGGEEEKVLYKRYTDNFEAYNLYLKGKYHWNRITPDNLEKSIEYYNQAIQLDPNFVLPYCGLADSYWTSHQILILPVEEVMPKAKKAALKALELDDHIAESHALVGQLKWVYDWDWIGAEKNFKRALALNPESLTTILWYSAMMSYSNRHEESFDLMKIAEGIDPLNLIYLMNVTYRYYLAGMYEKAIKESYKLLELEPMFFYVYVLLGCSYIHTRKADKAVEELKKMNDLLGDISEIFPFLGYAYGKVGNDVESNNFLNQLQDSAKERHIPAYFYALIHAGKGDTEKTFEYLEKAYQEHDTRLIWWLRDPLFSFLRSDKRYINLAKRLNFPDLV